MVAKHGLSFWYLNSATSDGRAFLQRLFSWLGVFTNSVFMSLYGSWEFDHFEDAWRSALTVILVEHAFLCAGFIFRRIRKRWVTDADKLERKRLYELNQKYLRDL
jgi:hypothetical protein